MNKCNLFSIVIPFFKGELFINNLLNSIDLSYSQRLFNFKIEILIIIDSPSTNKKDLEILIKKNNFHISQFITYIKNDKNLGIANTRNIGLEFSKGDLITFIDQDDSLSKYYFQNNFLDTCYKNYDFSICNGFYTHYKSEKKIPLFFLRPKFKISSFLLQNRILTTGLIIFKKNFLIKYDLYFKDADTKYRGCDDWFLYLSILQLKNIKYHYFNSYAYNYNYHESNYSNNIIEAINASISTVYFFIKLNTTLKKKKYKITLKRLNFELLYYGKEKKLLSSILIEPTGFYYYLFSRFVNVNRLIGFFYRKSISMPFRV